MVIARSRLAQSHFKSKAIHVLILFVNESVALKGHNKRHAMVRVIFRSRSFLDQIASVSTSEWMHDFD